MSSNTGTFLRWRRVKKMHISHSSDGYRVFNVFSANMPGGGDKWQIGRAHV